MNSYRLVFVPVALLLALVAMPGCASNSEKKAEAVAKSTPAVPPLTQAAPPDRAGTPAGAVEDEEDDGWPRQVKRDGVTYSMYQPQLESWENLLLRGRAAVAYQAEGATQATY